MRLPDLYRLPVELFRDILQDSLAVLSLPGVLRVRRQDRIHHVLSAHFLNQQVERELLLGQLAARHILEKLIDLSRLKVAI